MLQQREDEGIKLTSSAIVIDCARRSDSSTKKGIEEGVGWLLMKVVKMCMREGRKEREEDWKRS